MPTLDNGSTTSKWPPGRHALAVVVLTVLAAGVRLYQLNEPSLWYDELRTIHGAITGQEAWSKRLGYWPNRLWLQLQGTELSVEFADQQHRWRELGIDERSGRMPSAWLGIVAVPALYLAGIGVLGARVSFAASLLLAFAVWHVYWSQTARFYALQFLFYNLSLLYYVKWYQSRRLASGLFSMAMLVLASLSQPTGAVLYGVILTDLAVKSVWGGQRRVALRTLAAILIPVLLVGMVVGFDAARKPEQWGHFFQKANLAPGRLIFSGGYSIGPAIVLAAMLHGWQSIRKRDETGVTLLLAAVVPFLAFSIVGLFGRVELRYCLVALHAWLCLAALLAVNALDRGNGRNTKLVTAALFLCLVGSQAAPLYDYMKANGWRPEIRQAVNFVNRHRKPGDLIFMNPDEGSYYFREPVAGDAPQVAADPFTDKPRWVIYREDERGTLAPRRDWLESNAQLRAVFGRDGIARMAKVYVQFIP